jgi:hypothetical protein
MVMTAVIPLGTFERVPLRDAWPTEGGNFTPWLAQAESISLLGDALNMELEVEAVEHWVGPFRADILARAIEEEETHHRVIVENQFGRTDHAHLGQILTYMAGIEGAKTVVWIAERIQSDHRAAVDWLNDHTTEEFSFFAIEIELWRIGNSPPAPRFNVIASPNDWTKTTRKASGQVGEEAYAARHQLRLSYWDSLREYLNEKKSGFQIKRPNKGAGYWFPTGKSGCVIAAHISTEHRRIGVSLIIHNDPDKIAFRALYGQKEAIEREIGEPLDWQEKLGNKRTRIALYKHGVDPTNEAQWPEQHAWILAKLDSFRSVFVPRIRSLSLSPATEVDDGDDSLVS